MKARLSAMRERFRQWLWGDAKRPEPLPSEIEDAFRRLNEQQQAVHTLVTAMHNGKKRTTGWDSLR